MKRVRITTPVTIVASKDYDALCAELDRLREMERLAILAQQRLQRQQAPTLKVAVLADHSATVRVR
jgi:hypothetical protein